MAEKPSVGCFSPRLLLPLLLLFCFGAVFYTYFKSTISSSSWAAVAQSTFKDKVDKCLDVFNENWTRNVTSMSNLNFMSIKQQLLVSKPAVTEENTIILIWKWPFGIQFNDKDCSPLFGIEGCRFTDDRSQYDKAHGVMFHHGDIGGDLRTLLNTSRPTYQKWVWMNMESPDNSVRWTEIDDLFNLTSNYRRDSDVWVPYGRILPVYEKDKPFKIPAKDKLVCWIVSNWRNHYRRVEYFNELSKYIQVETYGQHFSRYIKSEDYIPILSSCKFYLSFENSIHKDYFTEKLIKPLKFGTVPVVLGPPRENYEEFIPADSFIHVDDFRSPQELAKYLILLDQNKDMYERYFNWRRYFTVEGSKFGLEHACYICDHIKKHKGYRVFKGFNKWYWG